MFFVCRLVVSHPLNLLASFPPGSPSATQLGDPGKVVFPKKSPLTFRLSLLAVPCTASMMLEKAPDFNPTPCAHTVLYNRDMTLQKEVMDEDGGLVQGGNIPPLQRIITGGATLWQIFPHDVGTRLLSFRLERHNYLPESEGQRELITFGRVRRLELR